MPGKFFDTKEKMLGFCQRLRRLRGRHTRTGACVRWGMAIACNRYLYIFSRSTSKNGCATAVSTPKLPLGPRGGLNFLWGF
jgi:hypothetical protein